MEKRKGSIPMNLQFFAEGGNEPPATGGNQSTPPDSAAQNQATPAAEEQNTGGEEKSLEVQIAELKAANAKMKADYDKLCTSEGNLRKQLRAKQTAEELEAEAKAEQAQQHEEYVKSLERFKLITEATERYTSMNMSVELAKATATAEVDGEKETVTANINKFLKEREEAMDKEIHAKYAAQMPLPQSGNNGQVDYTADINKAIGDGDMQGAALAILQQAQANQSSAAK